MNFEQEFTQFTNGFNNRQNIKKLSDSVNSINYWIEALNKQMEAVQEENEKLKSEHYKDEELQRMVKEVERVKEEKEQIINKYKRHGFPVDEEEFKAIREWQNSHVERVHGGWMKALTFEYVFNPTPIGTIGTCVCNICKRQTLLLIDNTPHLNSSNFREKMKEIGGEFEFQSL